MKKYLIYTILSLIMVSAIVIRYYKLGVVPAGFYIDEAGQGYSAYSILKTGKDEFGKSFPIVFRSFTDFKTPVYIYLIVPLIPVFGLSPFTVRFPSFFFSILTIPVLYFLMKHLSGDAKLSLLSCLLLAISPWHVLFGRTDFECNVALFFFLAGVLSFYMAIDHASSIYKSSKRAKLLILSAVLFAIAIPTYHSQRVITPLILLLLFIRYRKTLLDRVHKRFLMYGVVVGFFILLPTLSIAFTPGFLARASGLNIFSHIKQMPDGYISNYHGIFSSVINGSLFLSAREFFGLYFSYLSPRYMFILGDYDPRISFPELSTFLLWQFPFYIWGLWVLVRGKISKELKFFVISTLLISPIPAAVTRDPYTTIRALPLVIPQIIIISLGVVGFFNLLKDKILKFSAIIIFVFLIIYSLFKLYSSIIILNEYYRAKYWGWGWKEVTEVLSNTNQDLRVIVDNARSDPDLELAFFLKYDPAKYQSDNFEVPLSEYYTNLKRNTEKHIGRITTRPIDWQKDLAIDQYLIGDELAISLQQIEIHKLKLVSQINYPDGKVAFRIVRTNPN